MGRVVCQVDTMCEVVATKILAGDSSFNSPAISSVKKDGRSITELKEALP